MQISLFANVKNFVKGNHKKIKIKKSIYFLLISKILLLVLQT